MSPLLRLVTTTLKSDLFLPALLISAYVFFIVVARGVIPTADELIEAFTTLYARYGYEIIFAAAALEALVVINFFVPGMIAIALGGIFARAGEIELTGVVLAATIGAIIGYLLDFLLGHFGLAEVLAKVGYGRFLNKAKQTLGRFGTRGLILGFSYPNIGAFLSLAAGATHLKFSHFIATMIPSTLFWVTIWGLLIYAVGDIFLVILRRYSFLVLVAVAAALLLSRLWNKKEK